MVADGTYTETRRYKKRRGWGSSKYYIKEDKFLTFKGKAITVKSMNGPENCIIDCQNDYGVKFESNEGLGSVLSGFTITNAGRDAIYCQRASPTITNCIITNRKYNGISCQESSPIISNCKITNNSMRSHGAGISLVWQSLPTITNCNITNNKSPYGGIRCNYSSPVIKNCYISGNSITGDGGGLSIESNPNGKSIIKIVNCTITNNTATKSGGEIYYSGESSISIMNCIIYGRDSKAIATKNRNAVKVSYSNIKGGYPGEGNINVNPQFISRGSYLLKSTSPCIDVGKSSGAPAFDIDGDLRDSKVDMGADEVCNKMLPPLITGTQKTTNTTPLWSWTSTGCNSIGKYRYKLGGHPGSGEIVTTDISFTPSSPMPLGKHTLYVQEQDKKGTWSDSATFSILIIPDETKTIPSGATLRVPSQYPNIQAAIDAAVDGDTVLVADGTHSPGTFKFPNSRFIRPGYGAFFNGKAITVKSENGPENCIIDAQGKRTAVSFVFKEGPDSVLSGFTIINSRAGIDCTGSSPTISNCIITSLSTNSSVIGIVCTNGSSPNISDCKIFNIKKGSAISAISSSPNIINCIISNNYNVHGGAGILCHQSSLTIKNSIISNNVSGKYGGGIFGKANDNSILKIINCTIANNSAGVSGGGIYLDSLVSATILNSIIYGNGKKQLETGEFASINATYSNIEGGYAGKGNIDAEPQFIGKDDYHLLKTSPCIDAGRSSGAPAFDIDGDSRPQGAGVDMGADEKLRFLPIIKDMALHTNSSIAISIPLTATDPVNDEVTFKILDYPKNGTVRLEGSTAVYYPGNNFFGTDSFTFNVYRNFVVGNVSTVSINVKPSKALKSAVKITSQKHTLFFPRRIEAEDFSLSDQCSTIFFPELSQKIGTRLPNKAFIEFASPFSSGQHILRTRYKSTASSGASELVVYVNNKEKGRITLSGEADTLSIKKIDNLPIATGDTVKLQLSNTGDADVVIDYVEFFPISNDAQAITITQEAGEVIKANDELHISIPSSIFSDWDTGVLTATITGNASAKVNPNLSYKRDGKTCTIKVTKNFAPGDEIQIAGLKFISADIPSKPARLILSRNSNQGRIKSDDKIICTPIASIKMVSTSVDAMQTKSVNNITVIDMIPSQIEKNKGLKIVIPANVSATWDTSVTTLILSGAAMERIKSEVTYSSDNKEMKLQVKENFFFADFLTISGMKVRSNQGCIFREITLKDNSGYIIAEQK